MGGLSYSRGSRQCQPVQPDPLVPLFAPLTSLRGVGISVAKLIARAVDGDRVIDLLLHLPESYIDRRERTTIGAALPGALVTVAVEILRIEPPGTSRQPTRVVVSDPTGFAELIYFRRFPDAKLRPGAHVTVSGKFDDRRQMVHPDFIAPTENPGTFPAIEAVWPLTAGLFAWHLRRPIAEAITRIPDLPEWHDPALLKREAWPSFRAALEALQTPTPPPTPITG